MKICIVILLLQICTLASTFSFPGCYFYRGFGCGLKGDCDDGCGGGCGCGGGGCGAGCGEDGCGCELWPSIKAECDGEWGPWSEWSECNKDDKKQRVRFCADNCCKGDKREVADCEKKKKDDPCAFSFFRWHTFRCSRK